MTMTAAGSAESSRLLEHLERTLAGLGLLLRGGFHPDAGDRVPALPDGRPAETLLLVGNAGPALWPVFSASEELADGRPDPLNRWTERVLGGLAADLEAAVLYPFGGPPYWPFLGWSQRAERLTPSPLGLLIHPVHGLWHAYRGAFALPRRLTLPTAETQAAPCESCREKPCLSACPVGAFTGSDYRVGACAAHVAAPAGADCLDLGCRARRACPVGQESGYAPGQARFHMAAFLGSRLPSEPRPGAAA